MSDTYTVEERQGTAHRVVTRHWREGHRGQPSLVRSERTCSRCGGPVGFFRHDCHWCGAHVEGEERRDVWDGGTGTVLVGGPVPGGRGSDPYEGEGPRDFSGFGL